MLGRPAGRFHGTFGLVRTDYGQAAGRATLDRSETMKTRLSLALAAMLRSSAALGLTPPPELPEDVRFDRLSLEHGLQSSAVYCVLQSRDGFLWVGTENGLHRFDGHGFRVFRFDVATDSPVQALEQDRAGALWVGTYLGGLIRFDPVRETWTLFRHEPGDPGSLADDGVRTILEDRAGRIWIGTTGGLDRYDPSSGRFLHYRHDPGDPASLGDHRVEALLEDRAGRIWIATLGGLDVLDPATGRFRHYQHDPANPASLSLDAAVSLLESRSGSIWVGTRLGGLNRLDPATGRVERIRPPSDVTVRALHEDRRGRIWIGTRAGLDVLDPATGRSRSFHADPEDPRRLSDDNIRTFHEDRTGLLWIGTTSGGLNRYDPWQHRFEPLRAGLSDPFVWTVYEDPVSGGIWIGTGGAGLDLLDPATGRVRNFRHDERDPSSLSDDHVTSVLRDRRGALWVGTAEGVLNRMEPGSRGFLHEGSDPEDPDGDAIVGLREDRSGALWLATWGSGLIRRDPDGRFTHYRHDPKDGGSLPGDLLRGLDEDATGTLWIVTYDGGIAALGPDRQRFRRYLGNPSDTRSLSDHRTLALRASRGGGIWVGTQTGQLARLDPRTGSYTRFAWQDELSEVSVYDILEDGRGRLWLSSNLGLWRFDPRAGPAVRYGVRDGLPSEEFNAGAAFRSPRTGEMYFGGVQGLSRFHPERVPDRPAPPPVALTAFRKLDREVLLGGGRPPLVRLTHRDTFISFELAALDLREPERNRYAYRLEGQDESWVQAGARRFASYTNLRGGDYILKARAANGDGVWSPEAAVLRLHVTPPWWQTWWFRSLAALAVLGVCAGSPALWYRGRLRRAAARRTLEIETKRRLFEARERERLRLARELHDGPVQDLHGLRLRLSARGDALEGEVAEMRRVSGELRGLCSELRPPHGDLATALRAHALRLGELHPEPRIDLELMRGGESLPEHVWIALFRIAQEAIANAVQHAQAQRIRVRLDVDAESARLEVEDDGRGFALPGRWIDLARQGHFGLLGMAERAEAVGAVFEADSAPGRGTVVRVVAPVLETQL
ncbi:MAG TPA: two-component regulator propeller domain-containing protein [Thermoanaerobaculia bacterium]|nr:two-component regulator propeller domain-containing protein [Thermoanaerobaculia bacterium]